VIILKPLDKRDALNTLIDCLAKDTKVDRDELEREIFHREELMSTGIGFGVGVPHVRLTSVSDVVMAMGVSHEGIKDYGSLDGKPVHIVCMIISGRYEHARYIKTLAAISAKLKEESFRQAVLTAADTESIYNIMISGND
jgi:mannitol/fructose-specific phosphotransferase system IIA component (Ntr-type)